VQSAAGTSGAHIDSIQLNSGPADSFGGRVQHASIIGNYFGYNTIHIMAPDGAKYITVKDNIFTQGDPTGWGKIQMGSHDNDLFVHNTLIGMRAGFDAKWFNVAGTNNVVKDNIMINSSFSTVDGKLVNKCLNCTITHNLFSNPLDAVSGSSGSNNGTNANSTDSIFGMPTFVGGASPTNLAGYQLTSTSIGKNAATDGKDMGRVY